MKYLIKIFFLFLMIPFNAACQNWQPLVSSNSYTYFSNLSDTSIAVIRTDSVAFQGIDSVFSLNRVLRPVKGNNAIILRNQSQFLGKTGVWKSDGTFLLEDTSIHVLKTKSKAGDTWISDTATGMTASTLLQRTDTVFGRMDSMKVIVFSNLDTLVLSKNYGIVYYSKSVTNTSYRLRGIQNQNLGFQMPDFRHIYDFQVGDVFFYRSTKSSAAHGGRGTFHNRCYNQTILSRQISGDTIRYQAREAFRDTLIHPVCTASCNTDTTIVTSGYRTVSLAFLQGSRDDALNGFPHELIHADGPVYNYGYDKQITCSFNVLFQTVTKGFDIHMLQPGNRDTVYTIQNTNPWYEKNYGLGFGLVHYFISILTPYSTQDTSIDLLGCQKGSMTYGHIYPDSVLVGNQSTPVLPIAQETGVFPTLTTGLIGIYGMKQVCDLYVTDMLGRIILTEQSIPPDFSVDLSFLKNGIYFLKINEAGGSSRVWKIRKY
jgi:hypothetical protein